MHFANTINCAETAVSVLQLNLVDSLAHSCLSSTCHFLLSHQPCSLHVTIILTASEKQVPRYVQKDLIETMSVTLAF